MIETIFENRPLHYIMTHSRFSIMMLYSSLSLFHSLYQLDAHPQSQITGLAWLDNSSIVSVGQDCNTRFWTFANFP